MVKRKVDFSFEDGLVSIIDTNIASCCKVVAIRRVTATTPKQLCRLSDSRRSVKAVYKNLCFFMPVLLKIYWMSMITLLSHLRIRRPLETLSRADCGPGLCSVYWVVLDEADAGPVLPCLASWREEQ